MFSKLTSKLNEVAHTVSAAQQQMSGATAGSLMTAISKYSDDDLIKALKETLVDGFRRAIAKLSTLNGFFGDAAVRIAMPPSFQRTRSLLESAGQHAMVAQIDETINRAAEKAVAVATDVFTRTISSLSIDGVRQIVTGPNNAATKYLQETASKELFTGFHPIVAEATRSVGATDLVKRLDTALESGVAKGGLMGGVMSMVQQATGLGDFDLDKHVTEQALKGLFIKVGEVEANVRANPQAAASSLVQNVFSAVRSA